MEHGDAAGAQFMTINSDHYGYRSTGLTMLTPELDEAGARLDEIEEGRAEEIGERFDQVFESFSTEFRAQRWCAYCRTPIHSVSATSEREDWPEYGIALKWCENCRAWAARLSCMEVPTFKSLVRNGADGQGERVPIDFAEALRGRDRPVPQEET
jgi:hypothetical protein